MSREVMEYDVVIVGGDPSGLACAIRLRQLAAERGREIAVCLIEKGAEIGAHILSGAVIEPRALDELLPQWKEQGAPLTSPVTEDRFLLLTPRHAMRLPTPPQIHSDGNFIIGLGNLCRWLTTQAEALGVEVYARGSIEIRARVLRGRLVGSAASIQLDSEVVNLQGPTAAADMLRLVGMGETFQLNYLGWAPEMSLLADQVHAL